MLQLRFFFIILIFWSCTSNRSKKQPVLLADREAPLGWVRLKLYSDSSFEFISSGLRDSDVYLGKFRSKGNTLTFEYSDSIPSLKGFKAIIAQGYVNYVDATYPEFLEIKLNELKIIKDSGNRYASQNHLKLVTEFAEVFSPNLVPNTGVASVPSVPDSVLVAFKALGNIDKTAEEKYLTLIFLKLYRAHMQCCHQSYELRKNSATNIDSTTDALLYEYNLVTKQYSPDERIEFVSSHIAQSWVDSNKYLLKYNRIRIEYDKIKKIEDSIAKHLYWK
jgi:hypothetical protein